MQHQQLPPLEVAVAFGISVPHPDVHVEGVPPRRQPPHLLAQAIHRTRLAEQHHRDGRRQATHLAGQLVAEAHGCNPNKDLRYLTLPEQF